MLYPAFTSLLFPSIILAAPLISTLPTTTLLNLSPRSPEVDLCAPTSYTISNYVYRRTSDSAYINFDFQSFYSDPTHVQDPSSAGVNCHWSGAGSDVPIETECDGRRFYFDLRGPGERGTFQLIHTWTCDGKPYMSSTPHQMDPLDCSTTSDFAPECTSPANVFQPENVRYICQTQQGCDGQPPAV